MSKHCGSDLRPQSLRLPQRARDRLSALAVELHAAGCEVTAGEVARGLCQLALDLALGSAGATAAEPFRLAARDPSAPSVRCALDTFLWLIDVEPRTTPMFSNACAVEKTNASNQNGQELNNQALRLPQPVRDQLESMAAELQVAKVRVTAGAAMRGLCLLALEIVYGVAGTEVAKAFRLAASDPSPEGARKALTAVQSLVDGVPSTMPDPPSFNSDAPTLRSGDSCPPSTIPDSRAA